MNFVFFFHHLKEKLSSLLNKPKRKWIPFSNRFKLNLPQVKWEDIIKCDTKAAGLEAEWSPLKSNIELRGHKNSKGID